MLGRMNDITKESVDWKKAVHVAECLLSTVDDCLTIKPSGEDIVSRDYTDDSFDVCPDSKSQLWIVCVCW